MVYPWVDGLGKTGLINQACFAVEGKPKKVVFKIPVLPLFV